MNKNYLQLRSRSPFSSRYIFIDTADHLYERLGEREGISFRNIKEYSKEGSPFRLIICRIRNRDKTTFCEAIDKIRDMALLMGYREYDEMCQMMQNCEKMRMAEG